MVRMLALKELLNFLHWISVEGLVSFAWKAHGYYGRVRRPSNVSEVQVEAILLEAYLLLGHDIAEALRHATGAVCSFPKRRRKTPQAQPTAPRINKSRNNLI